MAIFNYLFLESENPVCVPYITKLDSEKFCAEYVALFNFWNDFPPILFCKNGKQSSGGGKKGDIFRARSFRNRKSLFKKKNLRTQIRFFRSLFMGEI